MKKTPASSCPPSPAHQANVIHVDHSLVCADCSSSAGVHWASLNRGILVCDECCTVHRGLGRHISQIKSIKDDNWIKSQLEMVRTLAQSGANSVWERSLLDINSGLVASLSQAMKNFKKKPSPRDSLSSKADFIRAKYQSLSYITRPDESSTGLSDQLHSSVRTPNLKISLRLLAAGADPNYMHPEKGNTPLHVASNSSQLLQIELLLVYGADPLVKDTRGNTALDIATINKSPEIMERLMGAPYEVTDRLSMFALGLKGIHETGHHIVKTEIMDLSGDRPLGSLSNSVFEELARDVYDEVDRRELNQRISGDSSIDKKLVLPFLPVNNSFSSTRNQGRQKLATLNLAQFKSLVLDVVKEAMHKIMRPPVQENGHKVPVKPITEPKDSEPLYDCVPSSGDSDDEALSLTKLEKQWSQNNIRKKKEEPLTGNEYSALQGQLTRSDLLVQELVSSNKDMRGEINRLQSMVEKLIGENAQLRTLVVTKNEPLIKCSSPRSSPPVIQSRKVTSPIPSVQLDKLLARPPFSGRDESILGMSSSWTGGMSHESARVALPSREEVFQKTETITKRIQGLLVLAQEGRSESFFESSNKITEAVQQMVALFPDDAELPEKVSQSLADLRLSALKLKTESSRPNSRLNSPAHGSLGRDGVQPKVITQQVIQNAFDIAKAAKCLVSLFQ